MYLKNKLKPGDFVALSPIGVRMTLQYNISGNLEKVFTGYNSDRVDVTDSVMSLFIKYNTVPARIHVTKGTSWVRGVLYTNTLFSATGPLPNAVESNLLERYMRTPTAYNFFAATFDSTVAPFKGATPIRQCLTIAKFKLLPGWLVPARMTEEVFNSWIDSPQYTFVKLVTDYFIFRKDSVSIESTQLSQFVINNVSKYVDNNGFVKANLHRTDDKIVSIDYSDVVHFNIHDGSLIVLNMNKQIIYSKCKSLSTDKYSNTITCQYCGKLYEIPENGSVQCPDIHCRSHLLANIKQFLSVMSLTSPDDDIIRSWIDSDTVTCIPDIFLLDGYKDIELNVSLSKILRALVPVSLIPSAEVFTLLAVGCTNNIKTFKYYVQNPTRIQSDLGVKHGALSKLVAWLSDGYNASDVETILNTPQLHIMDVDKKFEGAPIFRNKTIFITGDFIRGSASEIASILQSYAATVTTQFSDVVNCVLLGGLQSNIDGKSVGYARNLRTPIMFEEQFFQAYGIDDDLKINLVLE